MTWLYYNWNMIAVLVAVALLANRPWRRHVVLWLLLAMVADVWLHDMCNFSSNIEKRESQSVFLI